MLEKIYWLLEAASLIICLNGLYKRKIKVDIATIGFISIEMMLLNLIDKDIVTKSTYFVIYVLYFLYAYIEFDYGIKNTIFSAVLSIIIVGSIQMIIGILVYQVENWYKPDENILVMIINGLTLLGICLVSRFNVFANMHKFFVRKEWALNICFVTVMGVYFYCMYLIKDSEKINVDLYFIIIIFILVVGCVLIKGKRLEYEAEVQQMRINVMNKYSEQYSLLVEASRKKQHEFKNHIDTLQGMSLVLDENKKEEQRKYIDKLDNSNKTIKILNYVEQPVLAGFLYRKVEEIIEAGINIKFDLSVPKDELCIDVFDCIEIIGILLDNAVEAMQGIEEANDIILELTALNGKINISVKNISRFYENDEMATFFKKDYSTKGEGRGLGLSKIKDLQRKYNFDIFVEMQEIHNKEWISFSIIK